jgi:hypothetical protein
MRPKQLLQKCSRWEWVAVALMVVPSYAQSATPAAGNGVVAAPTAAAYADLTIASDKMLADLKYAVPHANTVILYDGPTFSAVPYYAGALDLVRTSAKLICSSASVSGARAPRTIVPTLDVGTAASGLASLIQVTLPSYAINGQALVLDNSALIGSFATAAKSRGFTVVNPSYLLPAVSQHTLECGKLDATQSLADLWNFASTEASHARTLPNADKKPLKDALDGYQKLRDVFLAADKGPPLLSRVLTVETLGRTLESPSMVAAIDMRLDAVDIDSTTRTVLWWRKTKFSVNVAAHYWLFSAHGKGEQFALKLEQPGYVNILRKDINEKGFMANGGHY